jgi:hypothetical protein
MYEWMQSFRFFIERIRLTADLSTRVFVVVFSCLCIIASGSVGYAFGRIRSADEHVRTVGLSAYVPWTQQELAFARGDIASLGEPSTREFVASYGGAVYYHKSCKGVSRIKEENRIWFSAAAVAEMSGYTQAKNCSW